MLIQLSPTVHVDPDAVSGIVRNRSESSDLRATRLYLHDGRTVTVDLDPADAVTIISGALNGRSPLLQLGSEGWFKVPYIIAVTENRNPNSLSHGRWTRLYLGVGQRSRTVTVDWNLTDVVSLVQSAQNPAAAQA